MLDLKICPRCGDRADWPIVADGQRVCAQCEWRWSFLRLPLFALTGPSAGGKSTVGPHLIERLAGEVVSLEQDVLWTEGLRDDPHAITRFRGTWLRMAAMIHQNGKPVVLCGTVVPPEFEDLPERVFFSDIHYLALTSESEVLAKRLRARPAWREWSEPRIEEMLVFNDWLRSSADEMKPPVELFDTTDAPIDAAVDRVCEWVRSKLP